MLTGFWTVTFSASTDIGAGVVTIDNNRATGGDAAFTYIGPIQVDNNGAVSGELQISRHSDFQPSVIPGLDNYKLTVEGTASRDNFRLTGRVKGHEAQTLSITGTRVL